MINDSILIISCARSGSSTLARSLFKQRKHLINEPWNSKTENSKDPNSFFKNTYPIVNISNIKSTVVKTLSNQKPINYSKSQIDFLCELIKLYGISNTIFLSRKSFQEHIESFTNLRYKISKYGYNSGHEADKWSINDIDKNFLNNKVEKNYIFSYIKESRDNIEYISKIFDKKISWYEDLYGNDRELSLNIINSWGLDIDSKKVNKLLNPKMRYRVEHKVVI